MHAAREVIGESDTRSRSRVIMPQAIDDIELTSRDRKLIGRLGRQFVLDRNERVPYIRTPRGGFGQIKVLEFGRQNGPMQIVFMR